MKKVSSSGKWEDSPQDYEPFFRGHMRSSKTNGHTGEQERRARQGDPQGCSQGVWMLRWNRASTRPPQDLTSQMTPSNPLVLPHSPAVNKHSHFLPKANTTHVPQEDSNRAGPCSLLHRSQKREVAQVVPRSSGIPPKTK